MLKAKETIKEKNDWLNVSSEVKRNSCLNLISHVKLRNNDDD